MAYKLTYSVAIPVLQKHAEFLIERHAWLSALDEKPEEFGELFSTEWTRAIMASVVDKGAGHLTQVSSQYTPVIFLHGSMNLDAGSFAMGLATRLGNAAFGSCI